MFGYVKPSVADMRIKEYNFYKQTYCGLCRELKKISRTLPFTLSYDFVFLALCRICAERDQICFGKCRCAARPFLKHPYVCSSRSLSYCAGASALLTAEKIADDINDSRGIKKLFSRAAYKKLKKILDKIPEELPKESVRIELEKLSEIEKNYSDSVYDGAECFGALLGNIFSFGLSDSIKDAMYNIGYAVGRWIYILDAAADIKDDLKSGAYNPFIISLEDSRSEQFKNRISDALSIELANALPYVNELTKYSDTGISEIIRNILTLGMPSIAYDVIYKDRKIKDREELPDERSV